MGKIVAVFNQKGGVGKTATVNNLAFELSARGKKVLIVDADQQENLSISVGVLPSQTTDTIFSLLCSEIESKPYRKDLSDYIIKTEHGIDIIPGSVEMASMDEKLFSVIKVESQLEKFIREYVDDPVLQEKAKELELEEDILKYRKYKKSFSALEEEFESVLCEEGFMKEHDGDFVMKKILSGVKSKYDYILIDCPPALSAVTKNILNAADRVLVPMTLEPFSASGLSHLIASVNTIRQSKNPKLQFSGLLYTMFENRIIANDLREQANFYKQFMYIYSTPIPRSTEVNKAFAEMMPLLKYNKNNIARLAYSAFCDEFLKREE